MVYVISMMLLSSFIGLWNMLPAENFNFFFGEQAVSISVLLWSVFEEKFVGTYLVLRISPNNDFF